MLHRMYGTCPRKPNCPSLPFRCMQRKRARMLNPLTRHFCLPEEVVSVIHTSTAPVLLPFVALEPSGHVNVCNSISSKVQARAVVMNRRMLSGGGKRERERETERNRERKTTVNGNWRYPLSCLTVCRLPNVAAQEMPNTHLRTMSCHDDEDR